MFSLHRFSSSVLVAALAGSALAACGSGSQSDTDAGANSSSGSSSVGKFPQTVDTKFGRVVVKSQPKRVAVVGYDDQDYVMAFGAVPVLARSFAGQDVLQPWAEKAAGGAELKGTDLGNAGIDVEKVAASRPDLIVGVNAGMTQADYDKLSKIAPVVAPEKGYIDYGQPWQNTTRQIGKALGQPEKADQLISQVEAKFAAAKKANPGWKGRTVAVATYDGKDKLSSFASGDNRSRFFTDLGFRVNPAIDKLAGKQFYTYLPLEKASMLDQDLLVWDQLSYTQGGKAALQKNASLSNLKAMKQNRTYYIEPKAVQTAFGWQTVLSIPYALDHMTPGLRKATAAGK